MDAHSATHLCTGDRHLRSYQEVHGELPAILHEFLLSTARWDLRMAAWLLYLRRSARSADTLTPMGAYVETLPAEDSMSVLLNYKPMEQMFLQIHRHAPRC